ncbi:MAG: hypothetical protein A3F72_03995 [Bacteroidetes bacterium RIFCSPLOWO2_12_FULL_35_15]|nr:MAG: hypothetical protein A3F72_03995 [Bacteroidetes bacterium RIFCSPLOWO2_12_FULL_35_15]
MLENGRGIERGIIKPVFSKNIYICLKSKTMKKFKATLIILITIYGNLFSQTVNYGYDSKEIQNLQKGPLYIIPTGNKAFDDSLKTAIDKYWKISTSKTLASSEVQNALQDENNCFIAPLDGLRMDCFRKPTSPLNSKVITALYIFHGGKGCKKTTIDVQLPITSSSFNFYGNQHVENCLGFLITDLNALIDLVITKQVKGPKKASGALDPILIKGYPKDPSVLKNKTLLIDELANKYILPDKALKAYKYQYLVTNLSEIISLLKANPEKYCFLSDNVITSSTISIFDGQTCNLIYLDYSSNGGKITDKQIMALNIAIGKK